MSREAAALDIRTHAATHTCPVRFRKAVTGIYSPTLKCLATGALDGTGLALCRGVEPEAYPRAMSRDAAGRAQMGPAGPNTIAWRWLTLILEDGDLRQAWPLTAPDLRRTLARAWVEANRDHAALVGRATEELTQSLAAVIPTDPLWPAFDETQLREFQEAWSWVDMSTYGTASDPRPAGPNEEGVAFVDTTAAGLVERSDGTLEVVGEVGDDTPIPGKTLLMRYYDEPPDPGVLVKIGDVENGWRVAALQYNEPADA